MDKKILFLILSGVLVLTGCPLGYASAQLVRPASPYSLIDLMHNAERATGLVFGAIAVICFVVAGILFLTALGDPEKLRTSRSAFIWGVVGVIVGLIAFSIIAIVSSVISGGGGGGGGGGGVLPIEQVEPPVVEPLE